MIGRVVGNYRIVRELGSGAMGSVYEGVDVMVERPVAIKMLRAEIARQPDLIERFRVEAVTLAKLNHPAIATLYSFFREGEEFYMVMEFVRGRTLEDVIKESGKLAAKATVDIMAQTLDGMAHAHQLGILHRDIKPANIMITGDGKVKVTDFGIARVLGSSRMTREGRIIGTLEYIAPERIRGEETDARSDLYSAGVVLFEMLSGRLPFTSATDYGLMQAHMSEAPPPMVALGVNCPQALEDVVMRALAKNATERFQSANEFRDAVLGAVPQRMSRTATIPVPPAMGMKPTRLAGAEGAAMAPTRLGPAAGPAMTSSAAAAAAVPPPPPKTPWLVIGAGLATLLVAGGAGIWYFRPKPPQETAVANPPVAAAQPFQQAQAQPQAPLPTQGSAIPQQSIGQIPPVAEAPREQTLAPSPAKPAPAKPASTARPATLSPQPSESSPAPAPVEPHNVAPLPTPAPPPSPAPHRKAVRSIRDVEKLYIERMSGELRGYVVEEIGRQLNGRLTVVSRRDDADAIMTGRGDSDDGLSSRVTGGYLGMKDKASASATITDLNRTAVLWTSQQGDKTPLLGVMRRGGLKKVAERLVTNLRRAIE